MSEYTPTPSKYRSHSVGWGAIICALLAIFTFAPLFVPIALLLVIVGLFKGQVLLSVVALVLTIIAVLTSPIILGLLGLAALLSFISHLPVEMHHFEMREPESEYIHRMEPDQPSTAAHDDDRTY